MMFDPQLSSEVRPLAFAPRTRVVRLALSIFVFALGMTEYSAPTKANGDVLIGDVQTQFEQAAREFNEAQDLLAKQPDRARPLFRSAATRFESIAQSGVTNGRLEYNIGNAYLQAGDIGRAILHYRRAERLIPGDALLAENLKTALSRCVVNIKPNPRSAIVRNSLFWHFETSTHARRQVMLIAFVLVWAFLTVRAWVARRWLFGLAGGCAVLTLILWVSVAHDGWSDRHTPKGVVLDMDVVVYKGPGEGYQRQFEQPLQPGVEFSRLAKRSGWWDIELPNGLRGWIPESEAETVIPQ